MKRFILKFIAVIITFAGTLYLAGIVMNRGNVNTTRDMERATLPIIYMNVGGETVNELYGYTADMEYGLLRESITPLDDERGVTFRVAKYGRQIKDISLKVRTVDGSRLIENIALEDYTEDDFNVHASVGFKDLMKEYVEYSLEICLTFSDEKTATYHTRIVEAPDYCVKEKLSFVKYFCEKEMSPDTNAELKPYMEINSQGDNTTLEKVTIHSSLAQLAYGNLKVKRENEPIITIKEIASETASFMVKYIVKATSDEEETRYFVEEYFRVRYANEKPYLLDFDRTMHRIVFLDTPILRKEDVMLGISDENVGLVESNDGNVIAFCTENALYSYNASNARLIKLFSFYDEDNFDARTYRNEHKIKALSADEAGNVWFAVFGYMNRGTYEGRVGVTLYYFNGLTNELDEKFFIGSDKPSDVVNRDLEELCFMSRENVFYLMLDKSIYAVDVETDEAEILVENLEEDKYSVSDNSAMMVWQIGDDVNASESLRLMNLNTKQITEIDAPEGQYIKPIVFMGEDFVYGLAYKEDVVTDNAGRITFPMYCMKIQSKFGEVLKQYSYENAYVTQGVVNDALLTLSRVKKSEKDPSVYIAIDNEYITNNQPKEETQNIVNVTTLGNYQKVVRIVLKKDTPSKIIKVRPKEIIYEGTRELHFDRVKNTHNYYYVYYKGKLQKIYTNPANAVTEANLNYGTVLNDTGYYVWYRANRSLRNQIMNLSFDNIVNDGKNELPYCLDRMLEYEGVVRNSEYLLNQGETVLSIMEGAYENKNVLDLTGCSLNSILYYINRDIPVLAMTGGDKTYLIIGYNQLAVVVLDPNKGWYKMGMNEAEKLFDATGNQFITYVPNEE